jgi:hypothetical protein
MGNQAEAAVILVKFLIVYGHLYPPRAGLVPVVTPVVFLFLYCRKSRKTEHELIHVYMISSKATAEGGFVIILVV